MIESKPRKIDFDLPDDYLHHTDKYFPRGLKILKEEKLNPYAWYQLFIRKGPGVTAGIDEAITAIMKYSPNFESHGGEILALHDDEWYQPKDTQMIIKAPVQDVFNLETMYLSILSRSASQRMNMMPSPDKVMNVARLITDAWKYKSKFGLRDSIYMGARHNGYSWDKLLAARAIDGGFQSTSTDCGSSTIDRKGVGTTNHAQMVIFANEYGLENYAVSLMEAFHKHIPKDVPRVFLCDTFNKEIEDTLKVANALGEEFSGPRIDTNGAVVAQGGLPFGEKYWGGKGVTVDGALALKKAILKAGYNKLRMGVTSGMSSLEKNMAFIQAEWHYGIKLVDLIGAGFSDGNYSATSDIIGFEDENHKFTPLHKVGRPPRPNDKLQKVDLSVY